MMKIRTTRHFLVVTSPEGTKIYETDRTYTIGRKEVALQEFIRIIRESTAIIERTKTKGEKTFMFVRAEV